MGDKARQGRTGRGFDGRADFVKDAHRARMPGGGEGTRQGSAGCAATDIAVHGSLGDVGQDGKRAGSVREPRRLGDGHVLVVDVQGGHQSDGDAGKGVVDH